MELFYKFQINYYRTVPTRACRSVQTRRLCDHVWCESAPKRGRNFKKSLNSGFFEVGIFIFGVLPWNHIWSARPVFLVYLTHSVLAYLFYCSSIYLLALTTKRSLLIRVVIISAKYSIDPCLQILSPFVTKKVVIFIVGSLSRKIDNSTGIRV